MDTQIGTRQANKLSDKRKTNMSIAIKIEDSEADRPSGMSRKHRIHSRFYWFTEFCNSQCLSHFAAPFISVQAKTFITEGCKIIDRGRIPQWIENSKECMTVKQNRCNTHEVCHPSNPDCPGNSPRSTESKFISKESLTDNVHSEILDACEWSFRRFTYGNLVTTSPSSKPG